MNSEGLVTAFLLITPVVITILLIMIGTSAATTQEHAAIRFHPQQIERFVVKDAQSKPFTILGTTLPQFAVNLAEQNFQNIWQAHAAEREAYVQTSITTAEGEQVKADTAYDTSKKELIITPKSSSNFKPGLYKLSATVKTYQGQDITITQDFTWGVLAINTDKATYQSGEPVKIGMGVLDDYGNTKCIATDALTFETAHVWLTITSPSGKAKTLSTQDGGITGSPDCGPKTITNNPDFQATMTTDEVGKYRIHMQAENNNGRRSIDSFFTVQSNAPAFDIERTSYPTRIYPKGSYPIKIMVKANQEYSGPVTDIVPANFEISDISDAGKTSVEKDFQTIQWQVHWEKGKTYTLLYTIQFPPISPEFYLIGPLTIGTFSEGHEWQIASDAIFALVQETHATANSKTVSTSFDSEPQAGHLLVAICYATAQGGGFFGGSGLNTPTGFTLASENSNTSGPLVVASYKIATGSEGSITCQESGVFEGNNPIGIQLLEFSGSSSTAVFDKDATTIDNATCTTTSATNALTQTNNDELLVSAFATAGTRTVSSHTNSFTDTDSTGGSNGFNGNTTGTYDSGYLEILNPASKNDTITLSGSGSKCSNVLLAFTTGTNLTQGGYRFFDTTTDAVSGTPLAAVNTAATLNKKQFQVRMLLDQPSASGTTLPINGGNYKLQYATLPNGGSCSAQSYSDVTTNSTISYSNITTPLGSDITTSINDPSDAGFTTKVESFYDDPNTGGSPPNITNGQNAIAGNQAGLWDFSLQENTPITSAATSYCLRIVKGDGNLLSTYSFYPQFTTGVHEVNIFSGTTLKGGTTIR